MTVHTEFHFVDRRSPRLDQEQLVPIFLHYFVAYFAVLCIWGLVRNPKKRYVLRIHLLMSALILIKLLDLIFAVMKMDIQPHDFYQLSRAVHNLLFYIIEALISVGLWKSISSLLQRVRTVTLITISLQIFADTMLFAINGHRARLFGDFEKWNSVFLATNLMCFIPVITLAVWSIKLHKEASEDDEKKTLSNDSSELRKLMGMYITAAGYLHFLYLLVFAQSIAANVGRRTIVIAEEGAHLTLCMVMLYQFRPATKEAFDYQNILENSDHSVAAKGKEIQKIRNAVLNYQIVTTLVYVSWQ